MTTLAVERFEFGAPAVFGLVIKPTEIVHPLPVVLAYSDIFQNTPSQIRLLKRIASHGYVVVAPEIYSRIEPKATVFDFDSDRQKALDCSAQMAPSWLDEDRQSLMASLHQIKGADPTRLGVCGWCFGGHLAFRAATEKNVKATACFYATGLHNDSLGSAIGTTYSLRDAAKIPGQLMMVWGTRDPHIPAEGRQRIHTTLAQSGTLFEIHLFNAEHAFMRDEGPRFAPKATDEAFSRLIYLFGEHL